jgi:CHASE3 domain sensor protein
MTTRANINQAARLSDELDRVTQALAVVTAGNFTQNLILTPSNGAGVSVTISVAAGTLTTMLTARQTAIQSALTALGIT